MSGRSPGRALMVAGFVAALLLAWAMRDPDAYARLTGGALPPTGLALLALLLGLAGAIIARRGREARQTKAPPAAAPPASPPGAPQDDILPEAGVETIRRRLREAEKKKE